jgi:hypothetical protein
MKPVKAVRTAGGKLVPYVGGEIVEAYEYEGQLFTDPNKIKHLMGLKVLRTDFKELFELMLEKASYGAPSSPFDYTDAQQKYFAEMADQMSDDIIGYFNVAPLEMMQRLKALVDRFYENKSLVD